MSKGWETLSWKQKKAVKIALEKDERMSIQFLQGVYSTEDKRRQAIKTMDKRNIIEKSDVGNKYDINKDRIPSKVFSEIEA